MGNRIQNKCKSELKSGNRLFCPFVTLGYPNLKTTERLITQFDRMGVDIVELGIPFSDPIADGPTIQHSSEAALKQHVIPEDAFRLMAKLRSQGVKVPVIFFSYLNPIFQMGYTSFTDKASKAGFDGVIVPDLPIEEERDFQKACKAKGLSLIFLITPTTSAARAKKIGAQSEGFVYMVSLRGVTGARKTQGADLEKKFKEFRRVIAKPILIGFGVSTPEQARKLSRFSDGVIVGSAIVDQIRQGKGNPSKALRFAQSMLKSVKSVH